MRKPITPYHMNIYEIESKNLKKVSTDINIAYRPITLENLEEVARLRNNTRLSEFKKLLSENLSLGIAAYQNGEIVGYGWVKKRGSYDKFFKIMKTEGYLSSFFVKSEYRGHSIFPCLIQYLIQEFSILHGVENFKIAIDKKNTSSINGAKKVGFTLIKELDLYRVCKVTIPKHII